MTVHNCRIQYSTEQSENLPSYLQTKKNRHLMMAALCVQVLCRPQTQQPTATYCYQAVSLRLCRSVMLLCNGQVLSLYCCLVSQSVRLSVVEKQPTQPRCRFGVAGGVGPQNHVLDGAPDPTLQFGGMEQRSVLCIG